MMRTLAPVQMGELPYVARRLLRLIAQQQKISEYMLRRETAGNSDLAPAISALTRHQLIEPVHRSHRITPAGIDCISAAQPH